MTLGWSAESALQLFLLPAGSAGWGWLAVSRNRGRGENSPSGFSSEARKVDCFPAMKFPIEKLNASFSPLVNGTPGKRSTLVPINRCSEAKCCSRAGIYTFSYVLEKIKPFFFFPPPFPFLSFFFFYIRNEFKAGARPAKLPLICSHINILCRNMCLIAQISQTCYPKKNGPEERRLVPCSASHHLWGWLVYVWDFPGGRPTG